MRRSRRARTRTPAGGRACPPRTGRRRRRTRRRPPVGEAEPARAQSGARRRRPVLLAERRGRARRQPRRRGGVWCARPAGRAAGDSAGRRLRGRRSRPRRARSQARMSAPRTAEQGRSRKSPRPSGQAGEGPIRGARRGRPCGAHGARLQHVVGGVAHQDHGRAGFPGGLGEQPCRAARAAAGRPVAGFSPMPGQAGEVRAQRGGWRRARLCPGCALRPQAVIDGQHRAACRPGAPRPGGGGQHQGDRIAAARECDGDRPGPSPRSGGGRGPRRPCVRGRVSGAGPASAALRLGGGRRPRGPSPPRSPSDSASAVRPASGRRRRLLQRHQRAGQFDHRVRRPGRLRPAADRADEGGRGFGVRRPSPPGSCPTSSGPRASGRVGLGRDVVAEGGSRRRRSRRSASADGP